MIIVGVDPSPRAFTLALCPNDDTVHCESELTHYATLDLLTHDRDAIRLVVIEAGHPLHKAQVDALVESLKKERIPVVTVNVQTWRKELRIPLRPAADADAAARDYARALPEHPDLRNQHETDAFCIAEWAKRLYATPRVKNENRVPEHILNDQSHWKFWPQFHKEDDDREHAGKERELPKLYIELLRQCSPDEPTLGQRSTLINAKMSPSDFWSKIERLESQGLVSVDGKAIALLMPWDRVAPPEDIQDIVEGPEEPDRLEALLSRLQEITEEILSSASAYTDAEVEALRTLLEKGASDAQIVRYMRWLLEPSFLESFPPDDDEWLEGREWSEAGRAASSILNALNSDTPISVLVSSFGQLRFVDGARKTISERKRAARKEEAEKREKMRRQEKERQRQTDEAAERKVELRALLEREAERKRRLNAPMVPRDEYDELQEANHQAQARIAQLERQLKTKSELGATKPKVSNFSSNHSDFFDDKDDDGTGDDSNWSD